MKKLKCTKCGNKVERPFRTTIMFSTVFNEITLKLCNKCDKEFYEQKK